MTKLGLGLAALGRPEYINIRENKKIDKSVTAFKKNTFDVLDNAYKNGIRYFDTAPSYGKGEQFLFEWHEERKYTDVFFGTKWGYTYVANWELNYNGKHEIKEHSLEKLIEQWETSKHLLPNLKYYQIHSATLDSGVLENEEVCLKLDEISRKFDVKIGLSASGIYQSEIVKRALEIQVKGKQLFDVYQITYNFLEQSPKEIIKTLHKQHKIVIIKEALANGRVLKNDANILNSLSKKYNVGKDAIAIRFVIDNVAPNIVLSGAFFKKQLKANLKANDFKLTTDELFALEKLEKKPKDYWQERSKLDWK